MCTKVDPETKKLFRGLILDKKASANKRKHKETVTAELHKQDDLDSKSDAVQEKKKKSKREDIGVENRLGIGDCRSGILITLPHSSFTLGMVTTIQAHI